MAMLKIQQMTVKTLKNIGGIIAESKIYKDNIIIGLVLKPELCENDIAEYIFRNGY